jgi:hypothetical protein
MTATAKVLFFLFCLCLGLAFIAGGCYLGVWAWLVGGICQIIDAAKLTPVPPMEILIGILKVIFCELPVLIGFAFGLGTIKAGVQ